MRFGTELAGFGQDDDEVTAQILDVGSGRRERIAARYLIAADGARSGVREALGIGRSGRGAVGRPSVSVYFRADLADVVRGREFNLCQIDHPDAPGGLASVDGRRRWVFMSPGGADGRDWPALLRTALGVPAPDLEVLSVLPWQAEMRVADRYTGGRVHLAGDAAHVMPPFAASGANTGIADVHNLGWKLAAVLRGDATPALLDSYDAERRPAGWFAADQSSRRTRDLRGLAGGPDPALAHPLVLAAGGFQYPAGALVPGPRGPTRSRSRSSARPAASAPGSRTAGWTWPAPGRRSTWPAPAGRWPTRTGLTRTDLSDRPDVDRPAPAGPIRTGPTRTGSTHTGYADFLPAGECLLLRPDHIVAWRGADPAAAAEVLAALLQPQGAPARRRGRRARAAGSAPCQRPGPDDRLSG